MRAQYIKTAVTLWRKYRPLRLKVEAAFTTFYITHLLRLPPLYFLVIRECEKYQVHTRVRLKLVPADRISQGAP